ncbi:glycogen debranching protein GlgX [Nocardioides marmorisolisilvae]|uniref:Glycogen debranching enzyme GlgX n=1 Tax=Nocardioides marmorisolisilvae TaxID=1542737 RepID=A0A3N0DWG4_9ACTN|nr:glycogen debranching protein GlgX [Nocardioides marmorisolisilvae]RNL79954.1 glycogen debranching enzyme GlgX [Nocardioides marmorisolisilvae]
MAPGQWTERDQRAEVWPGRGWPLGATWSEESTNFAVSAPEATALWVCLFDDDGTETRHQLTEHTLGIWHGAIPGVARGTRYGYRADGPWQPSRGLRFNANKLLLDPYGRAVSGAVVPGPEIFGYDLEHPESPSTQDSAPSMPRSVVVDNAFDWGPDGDPPQRRRWRDTVVYEVHVKGFTQLHQEIPEELRGTYAGLGSPEVIRYLTELGVTAVELLPMHQYVPEPRLADLGLTNYWGYNSIGFFAPHNAYSSSGDRGQQVTEFKQMVKNFHEAGIEVILDVVYNHTAEAGALGPTLSFRGLDDLFYHRVGQTEEEDELPAHARFDDTYWDVTGCGNTVAAANPQALRLILDSLRYWVNEMHVDGFRFDLLSALTRSGYEVDMSGHLLTTIGQDPALRHAKLIAEPWDASGDGYKVGEYPPPWVEWNDQFRDTLRDFWRGHGDGIRTVATRLAGSSDLYADDGRSPYASVNFITAHDGFTLRDLVSYEAKHNEANGEDNADGTDNNRSQNCGVEGETDDPAIVERRQRLAANLMITLCMSNGVPMITAGDERGRTQRGNNNAYSQDNEISWVDWRPDDAWLGLWDITKTALKIRREHPALRQRHWFEGRPAIKGGPKDLAWLHPDGREMAGDDWHDDGLKVIGMFVSGDPLRSPGPQGEQQRDASFLIWLNGGSEDREVTLLENAWVQSGSAVLSTAAAVPVGTELRAGQTFTLAAESVVVLQQDG